MTNKARCRTLNIALGFFVISVLVSGSIFFLMVKKSFENQTQLNKLAEYVEEIANADEQSDSFGMGADETEIAMVQTETLTLRIKRLEGYRELRKINEDMVGWIHIAGTKVDYPVMQTLSDPDFYLKHNFEKKKSIYGTPYLSENCNVGDENNNLVIYGHHMKDGSMFAELRHYDDVSFFQKHPVIQFDTMDTPGDYKIIGTFAAMATEEEKELYDKMLCRDEAEFNDYVKEVKSRSYFDTGETASYGDELITLITCEYTHNEGRLFVVGKRVADLQ